MAPAVECEVFADSEITDEMITQAASLFSSCYGIWGPHAAESRQGDDLIEPRVAANSNDQH